MDIKQMPLGPLGTNGYFLYEGNEALIIDPGGDSDKITAFLEDNDLRPLAVVLTHAHFDHIGAVETIRSAYGIDVYGHEAEASWLSDPDKNGSSTFMGEGIRTSVPEHALQAGKKTIGPFKFDVIHTPGHSPGSISIILKEMKTVISGDVLFQGGIGRTDLPGGDIKELEYSIRNGLYMLEDDYRVLPGHGPATTIAEEKERNPFFPAT